ncbi:hypothetical protein KKIDH5335_13200 [Vibrio fluvialis]|nr:hypothetical protein KKIDH5335_13200 [Vibrio fluvialis]
MLLENEMAANPDMRRHMHLTTHNNVIIGQHLMTSPLLFPGMGVDEKDEKSKYWESSHSAGI